MRAAVLVAPRQFELREVPPPEAGRQDALVQVTRTGICGTDVHIFNGHCAEDRLPMVGDPLDEATEVGAITTEAQNAAILDCIAKGRAEGAQVVTGGRARDLGHGQDIAPTLFSGVTPDMSIARDEIFGPVLVSMPFDTLDESIALAEDTVYGPTVRVWTRNIDTALTVTRRVWAGRFRVNTIMAGGPEMPLGGFKASGWGREAGMCGVEEYTQVKSVHVETGKRSLWIA